MGQRLVHEIEAESKMSIDEIKRKIQFIDEETSRGVSIHDCFNIHQFNGIVGYHRKLEHKKIRLLKLLDLKQSEVI